MPAYSWFLFVLYLFSPLPLFLLYWLPSPFPVKVSPIFLISPFKSLKDLFFFLILYVCVYRCFGRSQNQIPLQVVVARLLGVELASCKNSECMVLTTELFLQFCVLHFTVIHHLLFSAFRFFFFKCLVQDPLNWFYNLFQLVSFILLALNSLCCWLLLPLSPP